MTGTGSAADGGPAERGALLTGWALAEGFTRAGVATLEPSTDGRHLRRWLARGDHASMAWMARRVDVRLDPARLLPGARSALCVALQYWPLAGEDEPDGDLWPRVARYARGRDYHDVMGRMLKRLEARIAEAFPGCGTRRYVDTGPVLERELARRAGLGALGKNTHVLDRRWGSYFLLGEVLLSLDLEASEPAAADVCGRCTRCLDHCPTGALPEPFRLDSRRCISYWTIEHRGDLPPAARDLIGDWVFGCDVCQEVCPWNYKAEAGDTAALRPDPARRDLDLAGLLALDRDDYTRRFVKSPMKRAKLDGLQRNAAVAMGHRGDRRYVTPLARALQMSSPTVRRHAAWALGRIGGSGAHDALRQGLESEADEGVLEEIRQALQALAAVDTRRPATYTPTPEFSGI